MFDRRVYVWMRALFLLSFLAISSKEIYAFSSLEKESPLFVFLWAPYNTSKFEKNKYQEAFSVPQKETWVKKAQYTPFSPHFIDLPRKKNVSIESMTDRDGTREVVIKLGNEMCSVEGKVSENREGKKKGRVQFSWKSRD